MKQKNWQEQFLRIQIKRVFFFFVFKKEFSLQKAFLLIFLNFFIILIEEAEPEIKEKRPAYQFKSGAVFDGEWKGNSRDGFGTQTWPDGAKYEGNLF